MELKVGQQYKGKINNELFTICKIKNGYVHIKDEKGNIHERDAETFKHLLLDLVKEN